MRFILAHKHPSNYVHRSHCNFHNTVICHYENLGLLKESNDTGLIRVPTLKCVCLYVCHALQRKKLPTRFENANDNLLICSRRSRKNYCKPFSPSWDKITTLQSTKVEENNRFIGNFFMAIRSGNAKVKIACHSLVKGGLLLAH